MFFKKRKKIKDLQIYPDEIFMDSENIQQFDTQQFEGRLEKPINKKTFRAIFISLGFIGIFFLSRVFYLQAIRGVVFAERAERNSLRQEILLPARAIISDRNNVELAWGESKSRKYIDLPGFSHLLGYLGLPSKNDLKNENILRNNAIGKDGIEKQYEELLIGTKGMKLVELDSLNNIIAESIQNSPISSDNLRLTIDNRIQSQFYKIIDSLIKDRNFQGGSGIILDASNGEVISMVNWPEYDSQVLSDGEPRETINSFINNKNKPFLNRAISGFYAPGSIIKPLIAIAALNEGIISPEKKIFSAGSISIPNPYFPELKSVFYDWKAHGWVDMRRALAVSSDVYFYEIGGGFEGLKGLGIKKIGDYSKRFGFNAKTGIDLKGEKAGIIPSPELKAKVNPNNPTWRIGDTYNASIGQGNFQVTPIEMAVYTALLVNDGKFVQPHLCLSCDNIEVKLQQDLEIPKEYFKVAKEGMRMAVTEGTASGLNVPSVKVSAKTGTAEIGARKKYVNSWVLGFWPEENPRYVFTVVLEKGPYDNLIGGTYAMRQLIDWISIYTPEYLR